MLLNSTLSAPVNEDTLIVSGRQTFSSGYSSSIGPRETMEDAATIIGEYVGTNDQFYAIFDGHGGNKVAQYACRNLHRELKVLLSERNDVNDAIKEAFEKVNVVALREWSGIGCTAAILLIYKNVIYSANVGDTRIILIENGNATRITVDHKASVEDEAKLIKENGGLIINGRVNGVLALTRAIGDGEFPLIREPHINKIKRKDGQYAIIACDGVWDVMTDEEAAGIATSSKNTAEAARLIRDEALKRGSSDNVSVICVNLTPK